MEEHKSTKVIIGCTGSVATIKIPLLAKTLSSRGVSVIIVPTQNALHFLCSQNDKENPSVDKCTCIKRKCQTCSEAKLEDKTDTSRTDKLLVSSDSDSQCLDCSAKALHPEYKFVTDNDEWASWKKRGDPIQHIELRDWADLLLLAPLDANTLAKVAQGTCDNLLTCIIRAWDLSRPVVFCPAMNTRMYFHPYTEEHIAKLKALGFHEVSAVSKKLMCGEVGIGAMAEVETIVDAVVKWSDK